MDEMEEEEETLFEMDEEEKEQLETLTQEEKKIVHLLESKQQINTLKRRYESKLLQIASQLDSLTVLLILFTYIKKENGVLQQQLQEIEKKKSESTVKTIQELKKKLKKNETTIQQLQKWKMEYDRMIEKYRLKDSEVKDLQLTLKQVQAERVRFQKEVAKKAREAELQRRRSELEESKRRKKDRKEQEALEKQIKQLEIKLNREKGLIGNVLPRRKGGSKKNTRG